MPIELDIGALVIGWCCFFPPLRTYLPGNPFEIFWRFVIDDGLSGTGAGTFSFPPAFPRVVYMAETPGNLFLSRGCGLNAFVTNIVVCNADWHWDSYGLLLVPAMASSSVPSINGKLRDVFANWFMSGVALCKAEPEADESANTACAPPVALFLWLLRCDRTGVPCRDALTWNGCLNDVSVTAWNRRPLCLVVQAGGTVTSMFRSRGWCCLCFCCGWSYFTEDRGQTVSFIIVAWCHRRRRLFLSLREPN